MIRQVFERVIWVGVVAIVAIVLAGAITYSRVQLLSEAAGWVDRTERVRFSLQRILSTLQDAESAARGYLISHEDVFLAPYTGARAQLDAELRALTPLLADRPEQLARAQELGQLAHARLDHLDKGVKSIRDGTFVMPKTPLASSEAKRLMDACRALIAAMQAEESSQLASRLVDASQTRRTALAATVSMPGIAAALVVLLILVGRRGARVIRRRERYITTTLSSIGDGVIAADITGTTRFVNRVAAELTGWSKDDARGRPLDEVFRIVGADRLPAENPVARVLEQGTLAGRVNHTILIRRDGAEFPIEDSAAPIRGEDGEITGVVIVFRDASAARTAQQALQASEERSRLALEGAELGAVDHDLRTGTAVWNDRLYAIVGYPRDTPVTAEMINLHTAPEDWEQVQSTLQQAKAAHTPFRSEHRIVRANDEAVRWISSNGIFIYDKEGRGIRFIGVVRDVTENRRLESQVRQSQKLDALGTLAGGIARQSLPDPLGDPGGTSPHASRAGYGEGMQPRHRARTPDTDFRQPPR